jgi:membrane protease YdiL (CAAX protease family)
MTIDVQKSKIIIVMAWCVLLFASPLPELLSGLRYPLEYQHWFSITKVIVLSVLLAATVLIRVMTPLRALVAVLLALQIAPGIFAAITMSSYWRQLGDGLHNPFLHLMLDVQFIRVAVMLTVLLTLFILFRTSTRFLLGAGDMGATTTRIIWLGITGKRSWNRVGAILAVVMSAGTLTFLSIGMHPALVALPQALSMLPFILLFSITNALGEEITFRLGLLVPAMNVVSSGQAMLMSAVYFGLAHYYGIPSGAIGVMMAGFLGWIACRCVLDTKGIAWAFIIHVVQDIWIFWFMAAMFLLQSK